MEVVRPADHLPVVLEVEDGGKEEDEQDRAEPGPLALRHHAAGGALLFPGLDPPHAGLPHPPLGSCHFGGDPTLPQTCFVA